MASGTLLGFFRSETLATIPQRRLTFEERASYQRAIEEVYWRHGIWPKENLKPKPSLDEVMSAEQIEKKVEDYLRDSQALELLLAEADRSRAVASRDGTDGPRHKTTGSPAGTI